MDAWRQAPYILKSGVSVLRTVNGKPKLRETRWGKECFQGFKQGALNP